MDEKQRKHNYLTDKISRVGSRRRPILSYKVFQFSSDKNTDLFAPKMFYERN